MLQISLGFASLTGKRDTNQDYVGACLTQGTRGIVAVVADGVGGSKGGREAAELAVRGFIEAYYELPETLGVERAAARALAAINRWIYSQGKNDAFLENMATTFSALILRGRLAHVIHVGDTRIYRLRGQELTCLTQDHNLSHLSLSHVLFRAVGLEEGVRADYGNHHLQRHDRFLLCSDGVHGALTHKQLQGLLAITTSPETHAQALCEAALAAGSSDNVTAMVVDILELPPADTVELSSAIKALPLRDPPKPGDELDGFKIIEIIADGRYNRLCLAEDSQEQRRVVLKCPTARVADHQLYQAAFVREAWIAQQVHSPWLVEIMTLTPGRQTQLYAVMPYYDGMTLAEWLKATPRISLSEGLDIGIKLAKALYTLNRRGIIHRDIKPENVLVLNNGGLKLLDLGVALLPGMNEPMGPDIPGTPSYMAPELFNGETGDEQSDVYALGVTLYYLFSGGHYPFGEIEPFSRPRFARRTGLMHYRADLPAWLDRLLTLATAVDKSERLGDAMELAFELEHGMTRGAAMVAHKPPLYHRNPLLFWKLLSLLLAGALVVALIV